MCVDHDIARAVLHATGDTEPSKTPSLKHFTQKASKQSGAFNRSCVMNSTLQEKQLEANPELKEHNTLSMKAKNITRWTGLHEMCNHNRRLAQEICLALTAWGRDGRLRRGGR